LSKFSNPLTVVVKAAPDEEAVCPMTRLPEIISLFEEFVPDADELATSKTVFEELDVSEAPETILSSNVELEISAA